jgi:hypothetical protein
MSFKICSHWLFYSLSKTKKSRRVVESRPVCLDLYIRKLPQGRAGSLEKSDEWATSDGTQAQWRMDQDWGGGGSKKKFRTHHFSVTFELN